MDIMIESKEILIEEIDECTNPPRLVFHMPRLNSFERLSLSLMVPYLMPWERPDYYRCDIGLL